MRTNRHLFVGKSFVGYSHNETSNGEQNPEHDDDEFPSQQFWSSLSSATPLQIEEQPSTISYHTDTEKSLTTFQKNDQKVLSIDDDEFPTQQFWSSLSSVPPLLTEEDQPSTSKPAPNIYSEKVTNFQKDKHISLPDENDEFPTQQFWSSLSSVPPLLAEEDQPSTSKKPATKIYSENATNFQRKDKHISLPDEDDEFPTQHFWSSLNSATQLPDVEAQPTTSPSTETPLGASAIVQKRHKIPYSWTRLSKKMEAKRRRLCGESYVGYRRDGNKKIVQDQPRRQKKLGPACTSVVCSTSSVRQCDSITEEQRMVIFQNFWKTMDWTQRKQLVLSMVERIPVKRRTKTQAVSKRDFTLNYYLYVNGERMQVCQTMFLQTLDIKKWTVRYWVDCASSKNISDEQEELSVGMDERVINNEQITAGMDDSNLQEEQISVRIKREKFATEEFPFEIDPKKKPSPSAAAVQPCVANFEPEVVIKEEPVDTEEDPVPSTSGTDHEFRTDHELITPCTDDSFQSGTTPTLGEVFTVIKTEPVDEDDEPQTYSNGNTKKASKRKAAETADVGQSESTSNEDSATKHSNAKDHFDVYGEYIAAKLRKLDWKSCAHVQKAFGDILFDAEMGKFK